MGLGWPPPYRDAERDKLHTVQIQSGDEVRIGTLAEAAGLSVSTLRAWEHRYGLLRPRRTPGGHRLYGPADLARIREMQRLVADGHTPAAAAERVLTGGGTSDGEPATAGRTWWAPAAEGGERSLTAAYAATRSLLRARSPREVSGLLREFVEAVGGTVVDADESGDHVIPLDVSLGAGPPQLVTAVPLSLAREQLESLLPPLLDDARLVAARLRRAALAKR